VLRELGLLELPERSWLKLPRLETAIDFRDRMERALYAQGPSGGVADLIVLDSSRDPSFYRGRWISPKRETGCFIARRPQAYGAPLWGFALLAGGNLEKFIDFPPKRDKFRGCDFAWHLQAAIDSLRGTRQTYRRRSTPSQARLDFFSPLPLWAQRRLAVIGRSVERDRCLFSYEIPARELEAEENFLQTYLWTAPTESSQVGS
jgi:hypothetical protein